MTLDRSVLLDCEERNALLHSRNTALLSAVEAFDAESEPEHIISLLWDYIAVLTQAKGASLYSFGPDGAMRNLSRWGTTPVDGRMVSLDIIHAGVPKGYIHLYYGERAIPSAEDRETILYLTRQALKAIEGIARLEHCQQRLNEFNTLYEASRVISALPELDRVIAFLMSLAGKILNCDGGLALLLDEKHNRLTIDYARGEAASGSADIVKSLDADLYRRIEKIEFPEICDGRNLSDLLQKLAVSCPWMQSYAALPLRVEGRSIGILVLTSSTPVNYPADLIQTLAILSAQTALILKNSLSYKRAVEQKTLELSALYYASARLSSASSAEEANHIILDIIGGVVDYDESFIYVYDDANEELILNASRTSAVAPQEVIDCEDCHNVFAWAIKEGKAIISNDTSRDSLFADMVSQRGIRSAVVIPLMVEHRTIGILAVQSRTPGQYSEEHARMLSIIASQAAATYKALQVIDTITSYTLNIMRSIASGVVAVNTDGCISMWNAAMEKFTRQGRRKVLGKSLQDIIALIDADASGRIEELRRQVMRYGRTVRGYEISLPGRKSEMIFNLNCSRLKNSAGELLGAVLVFEDITERKSIEDQVRRVGQLAAIGQLSANVAHEIRNPLSSIKGAAQYMESELEGSHLTEFIGIICQEADRLNRVVTDFLVFARPHFPKLRKQNINMVLQRCLDLLFAKIEGSGISLRCRLSQRLPETFIDGDQMEQVFLNLIINGIQAMPSGGHLSIGTALVKGRDEVAGSSNIRIDIGDRGCGINREDLDKIFVPFYTTKENGSGLGLSIVHQIIDSHGGAIRISSYRGKGSLFSIYLPILSREAASKLMCNCEGPEIPLLKARNSRNRCPGGLEMASPQDGVKKYVDQNGSVLNGKEE